VVRLVRDVISLLAPDFAATRVLRAVSELETPSVTVTAVVPLAISEYPLAVLVAETLVTVPEELSVNGADEESVNPVPTIISSSAPAVAVARPTRRDPAAVVNPEAVTAPWGAMSAVPTLELAGSVTVPSGATCAALDAGIVMNTSFVPALNVTGLLLFEELRVTVRVIVFVVYVPNPTSHWAAVRCCIA
tara:strand:- start:1347 stop:1916 length:570 start_codon:yes stop_codon:yes gene_type:complete